SDSPSLLWRIVRTKSGRSPWPRPGPCPPPRPPASAGAAPIVARRSATTRAARTGRRGRRVEGCSIVDLRLVRCPRRDSLPHGAEPGQGSVRPGREREANSVEETTGGEGVEGGVVVSARLVIPAREL